MNELLESVLSTLLISVVPIIVTYTVKALNTYRQKQGAEIDNLTARKYFMEITEVLEQAVVATTQTYVDTMKKAGTFDESAQKEAFAKSKSVVLKLLGEESKTFIKKLYGDLDTWLDTKIEQLVQTNKGVY